jgi:hypothetical protein
LFWFFNISLPFLTLQPLISVCTQFHHLFFGRPASRLPWGFSKYLAYFGYNSHSINKTNPIHRHILRNEVYLNLKTALLVPIWSLSPILICFDSPRYSSKVQYMYVICNHSKIVRHLWMKAVCNVY